MTADPARTGRPVRLGRVVRLVALGSAVVLLAALPFPTLISPDLRRVLLVVALIVGAIGWGRELWQPRLPWQLPAVLAATLIVTAASALAGDHPSATSFELWLRVAYAGIALLIWRWLQDPRARDDAAIVVALAGFLVIAGTFLLQVGLAWARWLALGMAWTDVPLRPSGVGGLVPGPIWTSDYVLLLAPIAILVPTLFVTRGRTVVQSVLIALAVLAVVIAAVRALWVAAGIVVLALAVVWVWRHRADLRGQRLPIAGLALAAIGAIVALMTVVVPRLEGLLRDVDEGRLAAFRAAVSIFEAHPVLGAGPGTYASIRMGYPAEVPSRLTLPDPHNGVLAAMSDTGAMGLLAIVLTSVVIGALLGSSVRRHGRGMTVAACAGLAIVLLHRMMDIVFVLPGLMVTGMVVVGIAMGPLPVGRPMGWRRLAPAALVLVAVAIALPSAPRLLAGERALDAYRAGAVAWEMGDAETASALAVAALADAPDLVPAYQLATMANQRLGRPDQAVAFAMQAADREPMAQNEVRAAVVLHDAGRTTEAGELVEAAAEQQPEDPLVLLNRIVFGDRSGAAETLERVLLLEPQVGAQKAAFEAIGLDGFDAAVEDAHAAAMTDGSQGSALLLALMAGRKDLAERSVAAMTGTQHDVGATLTAGWFGDASAWERLDAIARADPVAADHAAYLLAVRLCRDADARRWAEVIGIREGDPPTPVVGVGPARDLVVGDPPERYPWWVWGVGEPRPAYPDPMWTIARGSGITCLWQPT